MTPDPWQADFLRSPSRRVAATCGEASWQNDSTALKAFHIGDATSRTSLILIVAPAERQIERICRGRWSGCTVALMTACRSMPRASQKSNSTNGSRVLALPGGEEGKTIRGLANVRLLVIDEAAQVSDELLAAYYAHDGDEPARGNDRADDAERSPRLVF